MHGRAALLSLAIFSLASVASAQTTALVWKFAEGDQISWTVRQATTTQVQAEGEKPITATLDMRVDSTWKVDLIQGAQISLEVKIDAVRLKMNTPPGAPIVYDSQDPTTVDSRAAKELADRMKPLIGAELEVTMNTTGEVTKVATRQPGAEISANRNAKANRKAKANTQASGRASRPLSGVTVETLKQIVSGHLPALPKGSVRKGASWRSEQTLTAALGEIVVRRNYTFAGEKDGLQQIDLRGSLALRPPPPAKGAPQTMLSSQTLSGEFKFDARAGHLKEATLNQTMVTQTIRHGRRQMIKTQSKIEAQATRKK